MDKRYFGGDTVERFVYFAHACALDRYRNTDSPSVSMP